LSLVIIDLTHIGVDQVLRRVDMVFGPPRGQAHDLNELEATVGILALKLAIENVFIRRTIFVLNVR
jgi:hypothetical protein